MVRATYPGLYPLLTLLMLLKTPNHFILQVLELCTNACEKHTANNENAAKMIKEGLDKRFGPSWHVVVGEGFGFEVSYELKNLMYMFFAGNLAVCAWKCS